MRVGMFDGCDDLASFPVVVRRAFSIVLIVGSTSLFGMV